jgi:hypothetical protein
MAHALNPNSQYAIINLQIAFTQAHSNVIADGLNELISKSLVQTCKHPEEGGARKTLINILANFNS